MKYILLVALREFSENARTKGFWIGLLLFPAIVLVSIQVPGWLESKAVPTRHYVLVDHSGEFEAVILRQLDRYQARKKLEAFKEYVQKYAREGLQPGAEVDLEKMSPELLDLQEVLDKAFDANPAFLDDLMTSAGWSDYTTQAQVALKEDRPPFEEPKLRFRRVPLPGDLAAEAPFGDLRDGLRPFLKGDEKLDVDGEEEELFAAILIPADAAAKVVHPGAEDLARAAGLIKKQGIDFWAARLADSDLKDEVERAVNAEVRRREFERRGMDATTVREIQRTYLPVIGKDPTKEAGEEEYSLADRIREYAPVGFVYLLWIAIVTVAQMLLNNTVEEKSNRIIEVLLSSVTPWELMFGKLMGIAGVGVTMLSAWMASLVGILYWKAGPEAEFAQSLLEVVLGSGLIFAFVIYFILGYLFYSGIFLSIGSICSTIKEAQNFVGPVMMIMMVPLLTMMFIPKDPNGTLATVLSWVPLYTPFVMMNRAGADPPMFDLIGTLILMIVSIVVVLWVSGKVFRIGILRTGQPPKILELLRWLKPGRG